MNNKVKGDKNAICLHFLPSLLNIYRKFEFSISQGSVATCRRWGGWCHNWFCSEFYTLSNSATILKIGSDFTKLECLKVGTFLRHSVVMLTVVFIRLGVLETWVLVSRRLESRDPFLQVSVSVLNLGVLVLEPQSLGLGLEPRSLGLGTSESWSRSWSWSLLVRQIQTLGLKWHAVTRTKCCIHC